MVRLFQNYVSRFANRHISRKLLIGHLVLGWLVERCVAKLDGHYPPLEVVEMSLWLIFKGFHSDLTGVGRVF